MEVEAAGFDEVILYFDVGLKPHAQVKDEMARSDPAVEEALYNSLAMRRPVDIDLGREPVPEETTVCRFRHLLEAHDLGQRLFDKVQRHLAAKGRKVATGTIVGATIISKRPGYGVAKGDPHFSALHILSIAAIFGGFILLSADAQSRHTPARRL